MPARRRADNPSARRRRPTVAARARARLSDRSGTSAILSAMSRRGRRRQHQPHGALSAARPATSPPGPEPSDSERRLLEQIADGELDPHLQALAQAINARPHLVHTVRSATALAMLNVGDRVRLNHHARPGYLHGIPGTVLELDDNTATICIHRAVGRFTSGEIRCPPLALDRLTPAS